MADADVLSQRDPIMHIPAALNNALQFAFHTVAAKVMGLSSAVNQIVDRITQGRFNQAVFAQKAAHYAIQLDLEFPFLAKRLGVRPSELIATVCSGDRARILNAAEQCLHAGVRELIGARPGDGTGMLAGLFAPQAPQASRHA